LSLTFEIGDQNYDASARVFERSHLQGSTEQWFLEVPAALWLLERVAAGDISPVDTSALLRKATRWDSGCCAACDTATKSYPEALCRYEAMHDAWQREQERMTPQSHPYLVNKGRVHDWNCPHSDAPRSPGHPGHTLHAYATRHDAFSGDLTSMLAELQEGTLACRRATANDITEQLARRNPRARDPRCTRCSPELLGAWQSQTSDIPSTR